ncbi:hypothetical protein [Hyalangium rubrum]|uniref:Uncharacterized protein n=1 Tax=Hyalangium rubrum TaxID=3103134 RepID=A0ABU5HEK2_9BACT|nr:hypothetical protein [Hyalangium sp. s54d21]MDY7231299.1 hypothetical protein [Hyalangium sp. s54d21]
MDPRAYRARVLHSARADFHALREHRTRLTEVQFLQHLEALFPPGESGPGDRFELSWWWAAERPQYTLHLRGSDGMRHPQAVDHVGALHERAVLAWVRRTTHERRMDPWGMHIGTPPPHPPAPDFLDMCLAEFPCARLTSLDLEHQEGYIDPPGSFVEANIRVEASLQASDGGIVMIYLGAWPEEQYERLAEWAREMLSQPM